MAKDMIPDSCNESMGDKICIECFGKAHKDCYQASVNGVDFEFRYKNKAGEYSAGLFLNDSAASNDVFMYPIQKRIWLLTESPIRGLYKKIPEIEERFGLILTHHPELYHRGLPYSQFNFGTSWLGGEWRYGQFTKDRLLSFIGNIEHGEGDGYSLRKKVAAYLSKLPECDCYGKGINPISGKMLGLKSYAFSIAMENVRSEGYFTEKLMDCILTETIPIYWGDPCIGDVFDTDGIVVFNRLNELPRILNSLSFDLYEKMIPIAKTNKKIAIENQIYSMDSLYQRVGEAIFQIYTGRDNRISWKPLKTIKWKMIFRKYLSKIGIFNM